MCHLKGAIPIPLADLPHHYDRIRKLACITKKKNGNDNDDYDSNNDDDEKTTTWLPIYCICRRGIASAEATRMLLQEMVEPASVQDDDSDGNGNSNNNNHHHTYPARVRRAPGISVQSIVGGYTAWQQQVDRSFPKY